MVAGKGKNKPWKHIARACDDAIQGRLLTDDSSEEYEGGKGGDGVAVKPQRPLVPGVDRLLFGANRCRLRTPFDGLGVGSEVRWATGASINSTCCDDLTMLRAEWIMMRAS